MTRKGKTKGETMKATIEKISNSGNGLWVYKLGPFTSKQYTSEPTCKAQATKHEKRGLSAEFWKRHAK